MKQLLKSRLVLISLLMALNILDTTMASRHRQKDANAKPPALPKVVLLGDSQTAHSFNSGGMWGTALYNALKGFAVIVNRGYPDHTTATFMKELPALFPNFGQPIAAVTIFLGFNDAISGLPFPDYARNLRWLVGYLETRGVHRNKTIIITPPPGVDVHKGVDYNRVMEYYAKASVDTAKSMRCAHIDLFSKMKDLPLEKLRTMFTDGVHLSERGSRYLEEALWPMVERRVIAVSSKANIKRMKELVKKPQQNHGMVVANQHIVPLVPVNLVYLQPPQQDEWREWPSI